MGHNQQMLIKRADEKGCSMIHKHFILLIKFLTALTLFCCTLFFLIVHHGLFDGIISTFLLWSLVVLCIPAPHGKILLGTPYFWACSTRPATESYVWSFMVLLNVFCFLFYSQIYELMLPTRFLHLIINTPYPCWIPFFTALPGTFYSTLINTNRNKALHGLIRSMFIISGIIAFIFFTHKELIILLHTVANQIA